MNPVARWTVAVVLVGHGLIHLLGATKGLGWASVTQLKEPISWPMGLAWLLAAALVVATGVMLARAARWWWAVGAVALLVSQGVIFTSWSDARAGTVANVILLVAVAIGYASRGSTYQSGHPFSRRHGVVAPTANWGSGPGGRLDHAPVASRL